MPLKGLRFVKTWEKFGIIYATDTLLQNIYDEDRLPPLGDRGKAR